MKGLYFKTLARYGNGSRPKIEEITKNLLTAGTHYLEAANTFPEDDEHHVCK
jgi:hypothetical protein